MLTEAEVLQKNLDMITAQKTVDAIRYELQIDRADKQIAQINAEKAKLTAPKV